jgi:membrane protein DedA with SNARE-associated domain
MSVTNSLVQWCTHLIGSWGLPGVFFLMVLESACIPVPSEAIMLFAGFSVSQGKMSLFGIVAAGVAANVVGSWIAYGVGLYGGRPFIDRYGRYVLMSHHKMDTAEQWFRRWGAPAVFFSRMLPIVRTFISLPAGIGRMSFPKFTLYTFVGCVPWVLLLGWVGEKVGTNWDHIQKRLHYVDYTVAVLVVALIVWAIVRYRRRRATGSVADAGAGDK